MKRIALALFALVLVAGLVGAADAQQPQQPGAGASAPATSPGASGSPGAGSSTTESKDTSVDVKIGRSPGAPSGTDAKSPDIKVDSKTEIKGGGDAGDGSALPRSAASDGTTIFGLSPTAAVIVAGALLLVVILAIVAMTRTGGGTYIDTDRRM